MISSYPLLTWYVTMYVNLASSFTYISVLVQFTFIFPLQLIQASIYALPFKMLGLDPVTQLCLWLLYTRIILQTLLNKIKELTHVRTYSCVVCTTNTCQPVFQKQKFQCYTLQFCMNLYKDIRTRSSLSDTAP